MKPFWVTLERQPTPTPLNLGVGITADSPDDARTLFEAAFGPAIKIVAVEPVGDISDIEQRHVRPNMGDWSKRGVWFPLGYERQETLA
jgi:hypothetical protein